MVRTLHYLVLGNMCRQYLHELGNSCNWYAPCITNRRNAYSMPCSCGSCSLSYLLYLFNRTLYNILGTNIARSKSAPSWYKACKYAHSMPSSCRAKRQILSHSYVYAKLSIAYVRNYLFVHAKRSYSYTQSQVVLLHERTLLARTKLAQYLQERTSTDWIAVLAH